MKFSSLLRQCALLSLTATALAAQAGGNVNVYNWEGYIGKNTVALFEKKTGIKVHYDVYDSWETMEAKLLAGNSGYDVVNVGGVFLQRHLEAGVYQPLDKSKLTNTANIDPFFAKNVGDFDPGLAHTVPYTMWSTGIGYNVDEVAKRIGPNAPTNSWALIFDPQYAAKLKDCGYSQLDSPLDVIPTALIVAGLDPYSENVADYDKAKELMMKVRPFITLFDAANYISDLANGDLCVAMSWSSDVKLAQKTSTESGKNKKLRYYVPKEGAIDGFDALAIPADAKNIAEAHQFIDFTMDPERAAEFTNDTGYPAANLPSHKLVLPYYLNDPDIYLTEDKKKLLFPEKKVSQAINRIRTRLWTSFKTGV